METVKFDMNVAIEFLKRQRGEALDQCAIMAAQVTALTNENAQLQARVAELEPKTAETVEGRGELGLTTKELAVKLAA